MRIGIAGLGKMGTAFAERLRECGEDLVAWNRSSERAAVTGLPVAATPHALAAQSDIVLASLFDEAAQEAVYRGPDGLIAGAARTLFIDTSTVRPAAQQALARAIADAGGAFIECPVGGTTGPARAGQLIGLVGGDPAHLERARPLLDKLCRRIEHVGPVGSGALAKLAINLPLIVFWQSFGEALALAAALGKDPAWQVGLFADSAGGTNVLNARARDVAAALGGDPHIPVSFDVDAMRKDLRLMLDEAASRGLPLPIAERALAALDEAAAAGLGPRDCAYVPAFRTADVSRHAPETGIRQAGGKQQAAEGDYR